MHHIALLLFDDVDLLDVGGPYEVFLTANRLAARRGDPTPFTVTTRAVGAARVTAYGGLGLTASESGDDHHGPDVLVVPGAVDVAAVAARPEVLAGIRDLARDAAIVSSVCTGSLLLARVGVAGTGPVTTHHEDVGALAELVGARATTARWVDAGDVVTAGGLSSGIAMALHLVDRLAGRGLAVATARQIEYAWDPEDGVVAA